MATFNFPPPRQGLATDQIGNPEALLEAQDITLIRDGEIRKRGGKGTYLDMSSDYDEGYGLGWLDGVGMIVSGKTSGGSATELFGRLENGASNSSVSLGTGDINSSGTQANACPAATEFFTLGDQIYTNADGMCFKWAGSTTAAQANTGTISGSSGGSTVTGAGGVDFTTDAAVGSYLWIQGTGTTLGRTAYRIKSIASSTSLEVFGTFSANFDTSSTGSYSINPISPVRADTGIFSADNPDVAQARCWASHAGRLFACGAEDGGDGRNYSSTVRYSALSTEQSGIYVGEEYWHEDASLNVADGIGGRFVNARSLGSELVFVKEGGLFALRGALATNGDDRGAAIDVISRATGAPNLAAVDVGPIGLVFANTEGLYAYNPARGIVNLLRGRLQSWWRENMVTSNPYDQEYVVSCLQDRIVVQVFDLVDSDELNILVYDLYKDQFTSQSGARRSKVVPVRFTREKGEYSISRSTPKLVDWGDDYTTTNKNDGDAASSPRMKVTTHPVPVGRNQWEQGRPTAVYINGYVVDAATDDPTLAVTLLHGQQGFETSAETATSIGSISEDSGADDETYRLHVGGVQKDTHARIRIVQNNAASDARIYGIGMLSQAARSVEPR